jgi:hypothetical protein
LFWCAERTSRRGAEPQSNCSLHSPRRLKTFTCWDIKPKMSWPANAGHPVCLAWGRLSRIDRSEIFRRSPLTTWVARIRGP